MFDRLTLTFEALDRFEGPIVTDLSGPLTVVVGPNGSGKSTILEAIAEVLTFFQHYLIEGPEAEVRKDIKTQRSTQPSWTRAVLDVHFAEGRSPSIGPSLATHFDGIDATHARLVVTRRAGAKERWTLAALGVGDRDLTFDTSGPIVIDSRRRKEAENEAQSITAALGASAAATKAEVAKLHQQLNVVRAEGNRSSPALLQRTNALQDQINALTAEEEKRKREAQSRLATLQREMEAARNSAIQVVGGAEVAKADLEAFCRSFSLPKVVYLQGAPDFAALIKTMTAKLGRLKDQRRSEESNSDYNTMRLRLEGLLKMHVTVDSTAEHALLIDDRPVTEVSAGTWCALGFAAVCEQEDPNALVIWDEPETGLHPTWSRKVCDLMIRNPRRFLIATHRTEFAPLSASGVRIYKSIARPPERGDKARCTLSEQTKTLAGGLAIAVVLGLEPSRVLFTTNAILWVEGPSDVIYWRFWLTNAARARGVDLVEGFDYTFMFSAGSLLGNETVADSTHQLTPGAVNLLRLVGASRVIVDTDFNPDDAKPRISRDALEVILRTNAWHEGGFVGAECRQYLKPRVREMAKAIDEIGTKGNLSSIVSTWGREAENGLSDDAFRRTLKQVYGSTDPAIATFIETLKVDDWSSYEQSIKKHFESALTRPELAALRVKGKDGLGLAQMSIIEDKVAFAQKYVEAHADAGSNLRPEAERIIAATLDWILRIRAAYLQ